MAYYNRGLSYHNKKQYDRAIDDFTAAIRLNPKYANAYSRRAIAYRWKGKIAEAEADNHEAKRLNKK
jgi:tetratricopeptide (TPR) repeat protein